VPRSKYECALLPALPDNPQEQGVSVQRLTPHDRPWYWQKKEARDRFNNETEYFHDSSFLDVTRKRMTGS
jgi:hypothetical protein